MRENDRSQGIESMLSFLRVLDLTDEKGFLCGKILADLGADVIKIEPPGGDHARHIGPFYDDLPDPEKSLFWFAFNTNKRSITLNIETSDGREIFRKLVKTTDVVIESFPPGYMDKLCLGYSTLSEIDKKIILTSISPFGKTGPYKDFKATDIIALAMSGFLYLCGVPDRAPVAIVFPQAYLNAGAEAAGGTMIALYYREKAGEGQHVDVSLQHSLVMAGFNSIPFWETERFILQRAGHFRTGFLQPAKVRQTWPCKDGWVSFTLFGGSVGAQTNRRLIEWMNDEGMASDFLRGLDWDNLDMAKITQGMVNLIEEHILRFFESHTKLDLYDGALKRRIMLYPVSTLSDIIESPQLKARDFWVDVEHPELSGKITYPGAFAKASETPLQIRRRPPLIGEHNQEIYEKELGLSKGELIILNQGGII